MPSRHRQAGVTLIEVLIATAIAMGLMGSVAYIASRVRADTKLRDFQAEIVLITEVLRGMLRDNHGVIYTNQLCTDSEIAKKCGNFGSEQIEYRHVYGGSIQVFSGALPPPGSPPTLTLTEADNATEIFIRGLPAEACSSLLVNSQSVFRGISVQDQVGNVTVLKNIDAPNAPLSAVVPACKSAAAGALRVIVS